MQYGKDRVYDRRNGREMNRGFHSSRDNNEYDRNNQNTYVPKRDNKSQMKGGPRMNSF